MARLEHVHDVQLIQPFMASWQLLTLPQMQAQQYKGFFFLEPGHDDRVAVQGFVDSIGTFGILAACYNC